MANPEEESEEAAAEVAPHVRRLHRRALGNRLRESLLFLPLVLLISAIARGGGGRGGPDGDPGPAGDVRHAA